ncbi:MAG: GreA/GreB family elongation factor, partial [Kiritimatiellae bacterium]|nr:GreA/GreB family elongation factor [Kiritimatiellia bacterium]
GDGAAAAPVAAEAGEEAFDREAVTSARSYRERSAALRHVLDVEMPQNRKDIEFAKSFGDLSENFEYESARAKERELVARQTQLEADLKRVSAFDFESVAVRDVAGLGSAVTVAGEDGAEKTYSILGDWDSAPELGILSHQTPLARALMGHKAGDEVSIPAGEDAVRTVVVKAVSPLSAEVLAWTKG